MRLNIIAAVASNNAIGYKNRLLYHIKADMARFRQLTLNHTVIMGRGTFESLPGGALERRRNIVLSNSITTLPGCEVYSSLDKALESCNEESDVFVIGGENLYKESLPKADRLLMTEIEAVPEEADAFFPDYSKGWKVVHKESHETQKTHRKYRFVDYERDGD